MKTWGGSDDVEILQRRVAELERDRDILDWLNGQTVDVIYLDDGRIIDVRGEDIRAAVLQRMVDGWPNADLEE